MKRTIRGIKIFSDKKLVYPAEAAALYIELGWGIARKYSAARMRRSITNCDMVVFARNEAGELVGISRVLSDFALETKILDMVIAPEYQRQGVGTMLFREIERLVRGTSLYCETEDKNFPVVAKWGFKRRKGLSVFVKQTIKKTGKKK